MLPGQTPHQSQVVFSSRNKMTAVVGELQTGDILIVTTEDGQQLTCGYLNRSKNRQYAPEAMTEEATLLGTPVHLLICSSLPKPTQLPTSLTFTQRAL